MYPELKDAWGEKVTMKALALAVLFLAVSHAQNFTVSHPVFGLSFPPNPLDVAPGMLLFVFASPTGNAWFQSRCYDWSAIHVTLHPLGSESQFELAISSPDCSTGSTVLPQDTPLGPAKIVFTDEFGVAYPPATVRVIPHRFGLYESEPAYRDLPVRAFRMLQGVRSNVSFSSPAVSGEVVTLQGVGSGLAESKDISVAIGKLTLPAILRRIDGEDELDFTLPPDANLSGCYVPVRVYVGADASNAGSIPVMPEAIPCTHPLGLSPVELESLDRGDSIPFAIVSARSFDVSTSQPTYRESLIGSFTMETATAIARIMGIDSIGTAPSCFLEKFAAAQRLGDFGGSHGPLDVGGELRLRTPDDQVISLQGQLSFALYNSGGATSLLNPGPWRITTDGGADVSALDWPFTLPRRPQFQRPLVPPMIRKGIDPEIRWDPTGYSNDDILTITLWTNQHWLFCSAPAADGQMAVTVESLLASEQLSNSRLGGEVQISRRPSHPIAFPMPLRNGGTGRAMLTYSLSVAFLQDVQLVE